mgnify:CR=1 FL=1
MNDTEIIKNLIRTIRNKGELDYLERKYFIDYVEAVRDNKRNNDLYEIDFLNRIILDLINSKSSNKIKDFEKIIELVKNIIPLGLSTENYEVYKNMIINGNYYIDMDLFSLFDNHLDYIKVINIIKSDELYLNNYENILNFAKQVSPYCTDNELRKELIAYINGLNSQVGDIKTYTKEKLDDARKKCGIYDVDEKKLELVSSEIAMAKSLIEQLEIMEKQISAYKYTIYVLTTNGVKTIDTHGKKALAEMNQSIEKNKGDIKKNLNEYQQLLMVELKNSKEEVFQQILKEAREEVEQIKVLALAISNDATQKLIEARNAAEDSLDKIKRSDIERTLKSLQQYDNLLERINNANSKFEENEKNLGDLEEFITRLSAEKDKINVETTVHIPGNDREVVPASPNVHIPTEEVNYHILPAFDESVLFSKRMNTILERKQKRIDNGELFHEMTDEVISCLLEGDWPYLYGPSGCGKSHLIKQVGSLIGMNIIQNGKITDKYSVMAYNDPHGRFRATQTFVALVYGRLLSLDEFDNGNTDTQVVYNEIYSGLLDVISNPNEKHFITFAEDMVVPINPNFRMISAGNTNGEGEDKDYSSRGKIDESVLERMTPKLFNYDNRVEKRIFDKYIDWYKFFVNFRKACDRYAKKNGSTSAPGMVTTRDAAAIVKYINHNSKSVEQVLMEKFIQTKNDDYLNVILEMMQEIYDINRNIDDVHLRNGTKLANVNEITLAKKLVYNAKKTMDSRR